MGNKVKIEYKDGKLVISADFNEDGEPIIYLVVDAMEIPDEVIDIIKAKKSEK